MSVFIYLAAIGATFNGILALPETQPLTLGLFGITVLLWLVQHWREKSPWYSTPLDGVFGLWSIAFVISILANTATWRRSVEALWYMGLYIAIWYLLSDWLARGMRRGTLAGALLVAGAVIILFGYLQIGHQINTLGWSAGIPRPGSLVGNPNSLGAFLVVLLPFAFIQAGMARNRLERVVMGGYGLTALALLGVTASRGAWAGGAAGLFALLILLLWHHDLLSPLKLRAWWDRQPSRVKIGLTLTSVLIVMGVATASALVIHSFSEGGREAGLRTYLWEAGFNMFLEKPLTGQGFFTFGQHLARFDSIPPGQPHSHAHNLPLTVAAEMGLPGVLALTATIAVILSGIRRNARELPVQERPVWLAAVAALAGFGIHHLLDTPAMMPLIALMGLLALVLAIAPAHPQTLVTPWRKTGQPVASAVLWVILLIAGFWNSHLYRQYYNILKTALETRAYFNAAEQMQTVVEADPRQPAYLLEQAYLYGLAASEGSKEAAARAITLYQRYLELEPYHTAAWANLAALAWQSSNDTLAVTAIDRAAQLAPGWGFPIQQALYSGSTAAQEDFIPPESMWGANMARYQYLRDVIVTEFLPQVGWMTRR